MKLGLVLGGVAQGAMDTYKTQQDQARLQQAANDAHAQQQRIQDQQHAMDMASAHIDNAATVADVGVTTGAIPTPATAPPADGPVTVTGPSFVDSASRPLAPTPYAPPPVTGEATSAPPTGVRGIRNNNWGNLRPPPNGRTWAGQTGVDTSGDAGAIGGGFAQFATPEAGIAATLQNLRAKASAHGLNTVNDIIAKPGVGWDPGNLAYAATVAKSLGVAGDAPLNMGDPSVIDGLSHAIFTQENGAGAYHHALATLGQAHAPAAASAPGRPPAPGSQRGPAAPPATDLFSSSGSVPAVYPAPDGSGLMVTHTPRIATQDDVDNAIAHRQAAIARAYGHPDQAALYEKGITDRQLAAQSVASGALEARRNQVMNSVSQAQTVDDMANVYDGFSDRQHVHVIQDSNGHVTANFFNNDTGKQNGVDHFDSIADMKGKVAQMISSPAGYRAAQDAHDTIVHTIAKTDADANLAQAGAANATASAANTNAGVAAGIPASTAAANTAQAAEANSRAAELARQTKLATDAQTESAALANATTDADRATHRSNLAVLSGQMSPVQAQVYDNGVQTTQTTYNGPGGLRTVPDQQLGEVEVGQQAAVKAALAQAKKQDVPLTYGRHVDQYGRSTMAYSIAGKPELGTSNSADAMFSAYEKAGAKARGGALPPQSSGFEGTRVAPAVAPVGSFGGG